MATVQDEINERLNVPLVIAAVMTSFIGLVLSLTGALMFIGIPLIIFGIAWGIVLYYSAKFRTYSRHFH